MSPLRLAALATLATLAACGDQQDKGPERKTAAGEVLGGSISDAMLPLDTVQSQSPPLRESVTASEDAPDNAEPSSERAAKPAAAASPSAASSPSAAASPSSSPQAED